MCVRVLRSTKISHFYTKNTIFNFSRNLQFWLKNLPKPHSKHICAVWDTENMAEKRIFWNSKNGHFGSPLASRTGRMGRKGVAKAQLSCEFRQNRTRAADTSYSKLRPSYVQTLLSITYPINSLVQSIWYPPFFLIITIILLSSNVEVHVAPSIQGLELVRHGPYYCFNAIEFFFL